MFYVSDISERRPPFGMIGRLTYGVFWFQLGIQRADVCLSVSADDWVVDASCGSRMEEEEVLLEVVSVVYAGWVIVQEGLRTEACKRINVVFESYWRALRCQ